MSEPEKVNEDPTSEKTAQPPPVARRKPRLNRRGFHLINNPLVGLLTNNSVEENSNVNGNDTSESKDKAISPQDVPKKKIISLSSVKSTLSDQKSVQGKKSETIILKNRNPLKRDSQTVVTSSSSDPPAKKKHKPITWP